MDKYKLLFEILKCVQFGNFKLASGKISPYKIDIDPLIINEERLNFLANQMYGFSIKNGFKPDYFIGVPSGTTMLARKMSEMINYLPPEKKKVVWREKGDLEFKGPMEEGDKVVIVEDVVTTGGSLEYEVHLARKYGVNVLGAISIVDRLERDKEFDFTYFYVFDVNEIFKALEMQIEIPKEVKDYLRENVRKVA
jgi:orotate phosphoribosyltransferase